MVGNEYLLAFEAHRRVAERLEQAERQAIVAATHSPRPPLRVRLGAALVRLGQALQASRFPLEPARALGHGGRGVPASRT